ncbi:cytochrome P450 [Microbispora sp. RL4-1S]|uniref:Cytochrome P450 n=1 Tax=Microbispora oryzae TaxID=2806554 RepID=A0A940WEM5_9ACTN|nr:cytochrome P450 [Microbispora oryzae]MBP2704135.1 cytochrome P450 [Microbispora oryzae]
MTETVETDLSAAPAWTAASPFTAVNGDDRHEVYAALLADGPVHQITTPTGVTAWLVTGHAEARALLSDPRLVKGGWQAAVYARELPEEVARGIFTHMLSSDGADHVRLRKLVTAAFTRRRVEKLVPRIQRMTDELLDAVEGEETVDLISALAFPLPIGVICDLIGIPQESRADFRAWTAPLVAPGIFSFEEFAEAAAAMLRFSRELIEEKRRSPLDDLLSDLIAVRDDGEGLTEDELTSMIFLLVVAGHETTVNLIGNGVRALLANPGQLALLRERPALLEPAIEELLRHDGPLQNTLPYRTTEPVEVGGVTIPEGVPVIVSLLAANRDPALYAEGDTLDITRAAPTHVAFGHGIHYCVGAPLARVEARIAFATLLDRFPRMRLAVPDDSLTRAGSMIMNGLTALPVQLR